MANKISDGLIYWVALPKHPSNSSVLIRDRSRTWSLRTDLLTLTGISFAELQMGSEVPAPIRSGILDGFSAAIYLSFVVKV